MRNFIKEHKDLLSTILILASAPLLAWLLTLFVFQSYVVDGSSMQTTLKDKDRLIVTKYKKTLSKITSNDYIPNRYDIVVFDHRDRYGMRTVEDKQLIKRVIGVPGDRVVIADGIVKVYNKDHPDGFNVDREGPERNASTVNLTEGHIDQTINAGEIFVLGDNRSNSLDSRVFGTLPSGDIVGKANFRIYPFDKSQRL
ncbi:signal peptidase I [Candidatus Saccharibacteria bacterium RIFCSPHIGHO2_12_FULL_41_12]|nr:MAG: signal peptidase I [Candidatus Saccharibacteria bacterium RIFCSPHIGHO2_12_FULL_41_12]